MKKKGKMLDTQKAYIYTKKLKPATKSVTN